MLNRFLDAWHGFYCTFLLLVANFLHSLQTVLEYIENWNEPRERQWQRMRDVIIRAAKKKGWHFSRIGLSSNHVHVLLGASVTDFPPSVALSGMNNMAYVYEMKPILKFSFYAGTLGGYDRGVVRIYIT